MSRTRRHNPTWLWMTRHPTRDGGYIGSPRSDWKRMRRQQRRAREAHAVRTGREPPLWRRCDMRDWW